MGTLTKRPKTPPIQQFYQPAPTVPVAPSSPAPEPENSAPSEDEVRKEVRQESLLRRSRGRLGTVITGFRGLLSEAANNNQGAERKTLLGE